MTDDLTNASREELLAVIERLQDNWIDLAARADRAEQSLLVDAFVMSESVQEFRLQAKASGVALVRDYMRAY